jgi:hypothetical protein
VLDGLVRNPHLAGHAPVLQLTRPISPETRWMPLAIDWLYLFQITTLGASIPQSQARFPDFQSL